MKVSDFYTTESSWLKAGDLGGKKHRLKISDIEIVEFKEGKKVAVRFAGKEKGLVLNKTNAQIISKQYGEDTDGWVGNEVIVYPTTTDFGGEQVDCIRIEQHVPEADPDDDIPFN